MELVGYVLLGFFLKSIWDWLRGTFRNRAERNRIRNYWVDELTETQTELRGLFTCLRDEDQASTAAPELYALALESAITRHMDTRDTLSALGGDARESILVFYRNVRGMISIVKGARANAVRSDLHRIDFDQLHEILPSVLLRGRQASLLLRGSLERPWPKRAWKQPRKVVTHPIEPEVVQEEASVESEPPRTAQIVVRGPKLDST